MKSQSLDHSDCFAKALVLGTISLYDSPMTETSLGGGSIAETDEDGMEEAVRLSTQARSPGIAQFETAVGARLFTEVSNFEAHEQ